jgi:PHD/YefM family antitoxin component YafN of YafNO toxin-antitoxin module
LATISATEFAKNFGRYRELVQREAIAVTSHERVTGYFVSEAEYKDYLRLKAMASKTYAVEELSEATIRAIAASKMDARHNHLNSLLDD